MSYKTFKLLQTKFILDDTGPAPVMIDKILWQMLRDKQIIMWVATDNPTDLGLGVMLPPRYKDYEISTIC